jgi:site-specific DNA recombinase
MGKGHYSILRVSHLSQIGNFSIVQQKESIETYARFHSIEITEHLAECGSGTTNERKQIQTLYRLIEEDKVEGILCYKLDRVFRNMKLSIDFIATCVEKGIKIHSVAENISTDTPAGMFMVNCLLSVNQYAVDNIRSLVKGGLKTMAKSGLKATGSVYGYSRSDDKSLKVVESESVVVSKIFKLYSEHKSLGRVAGALNRQKVLTRRGKWFSRMTIKNILNNKTYIGRIVHNGMETKAIHKPIVSTRMWNRCNQMLSG